MEKEDLLNQIGKRIFDRRKQLHMTQDELAFQADITPQTVSSTELGKKALRPENIIRICSALDISTDYLILGKINSEDHSTLPLKFIREKEKRWLTTTIFSPFHVIMELCKNKIIITNFLN